MLGADACKATRGTSMALDHRKNKNVLTANQLEVLRRHEQDLRGRLDRLNRSLSEWGYVEGSTVHDETEVDEDSGDIHLDMVPTFLDQREKVTKALANQTALLASYILELLTYERFCVDTLANPEHAEEHADRQRELNQLEGDLPDWRKAFWLLTGKSIGLPNSSEETRDAQGRTTWIVEYDESGYGTTVFHADYDDECNPDLDLDEKMV